MSDKQPGNPYIWYSGYLNLDFQEVEYFRFSLRLRNRCRKDCGYVALDDITLQCEAEKTNTLPLAECQKRAIPIPGCNIDALQPVHKGKLLVIFCIPLKTVQYISQMTLLYNLRYNTKVDTTGIKRLRLH